MKITLKPTITIDYNPKIVARKNKYMLEHSIVRGFFGEPKDLFEVTWIDEIGHKHHKPISPPIRVNVTNLVFEPLRPYSKEEYQSILDENI